MKIATWNVNSINAHLEAAKNWIVDAKPDVLCLQELKCEDSSFPTEEFRSMGYSCAIHGQKTYNGVAILSRFGIENILRKLPGDDSDDQARYIEATVFTPRPLTVACLYLPNGNPVPGNKYDYKLAWLKRLNRHAANLLKSEQRVVMAGDYNVIPMPDDAKNPEKWTTDALFLPTTRAAHATLCAEGWTDPIRSLYPLQSGPYTFWDYQAGAWQKDNGIRIDHLLLSPQAADDLENAGVDKHVRAWERPSDHVPAWIELRP
jgi:exodeoxyribonuclease III